MIWARTISKYIQIVIVVALLCATQIAGLQNATEPIDTMAQNYLSAEQNLWHLVQTTSPSNNEYSMLYVYETHEEFLGKTLSETDIFDELSKQRRQHQYQPYHHHQQHQSNRKNSWDEPRIMERHLSRVADNIESINKTALKIYRFLSHHQYENLPSLVEDVVENIPKMISTVCKYVDGDFWTFLRNVGKYLCIFFMHCFTTQHCFCFLVDYHTEQISTFCCCCSCRSQNSQTCYVDRVYVISENQVLYEFYREIVAAMLKGYMLVQMSYMILTLNALGMFHGAHNIKLLMHDVTYYLPDSNPIFVYFRKLS